MKRTITTLAVLLTLSSVFSQTEENFNSRPASGLKSLKNDLQDHCWQFRDFAVNNGWDPAIEGDGAIVSGTQASPSQQAGIFSPQLAFAGKPVKIAFTYKFSAQAADRRWIKIYSAAGDNTLLALLDSIELTGASNSSVYHYDKALTLPVPGNFKLFINYQGSGGDNRIAIDQLSIAAPAAYFGGCNQPPVAVNDIFAGNAILNATGNLLHNDHDAESNLLTARLLTPSPDGEVTLTPSGDFNFTPHDNFHGSTTNFSYMVCDNGAPSLCSEPAMVTINFKTKGAPAVAISDFGAVYTNDRVNVKWTTGFELNNDRFEVERSTDGINFGTAAVVKGAGNSTLAKEYQINDDISKSVLNKNDLYYRLKQVDADGNTTFTKVLVVRVYRTKSLQSLSVTPNPAINDIRVNVELNENSYVVMKVANNNGIEMMRKTTRASEGSNSFGLEGTSRLQPGIYFLEVIVNSRERMMVKLVKS